MICTSELNLSSWKLIDVNVCKAKMAIYNKCKKNI